MPLPMLMLAIDTPFTFDAAITPYAAAIYVYATLMHCLITLDAAFAADISWPYAMPPLRGAPLYA